MSETRFFPLCCWGNALYAFQYGDIQTEFAEKNTLLLPEGVKPEEGTVQMKLQSDPARETISYSFMEERE